MRSDNTTATVAGGVVGGGLVGIVIIVVIVIVIVIIVKNKQESSKCNGRSISVCVYNNLMLSIQLMEVQLEEGEQPTMTYHVRTTWCMVCVR